MISKVFFACIKWLWSSKTDFYTALATQWSFPASLWIPLQTHDGQPIICYKAQHVYKVMVEGLNFSLDSASLGARGEEEGRCWVPEASFCKEALWLADHTDSCRQVIMPALTMVVSVCGHSQSRPVSGPWVCESPVECYFGSFWISFFPSFFFLNLFI